MRLNKQGKQAAHANTALKHDKPSFARPVCRGALLSWGFLPRPVPLD
jgi:hypothetical protein